MTTRERIEAITQNLVGWAEMAAAFGHKDEAKEFLSAADCLSDILADLPAETPPTLEEFRESGEWFVSKDHDGNMRVSCLRLTGDEWLLFDWDWQCMQYGKSLSDISLRAIARMPRFYPVEGGE